jgi:hypothetical protein
VIEFKSSFLVIEFKSSFLVIEFKSSFRKINDCHQVSLLTATENTCHR